MSQYLGWLKSPTQAQFILGAIFGPYFQVMLDFGQSNYSLKKCK